MTELMWIGAVLVAIAMAFVLGLLVYAFLGTAIGRLFAGLRRPSRAVEIVYMEQVTSGLFLQVLDPPPALLELLDRLQFNSAEVVFYRIDSDGWAIAADSPFGLGPIVDWPASRLSSEGKGRTA
ncbi:MAG: hypothetical protein D3X82_16730 [Candidatus Leucobacter sulfamidivorax]|nr:hypothetical protein [Candidatus Leucobacter sulfamidivorax]